MTIEIDEIVRTIYENGQFSGAVLVAVNGEIVYNDAIGDANIENRILNSFDTKFRIASFTKPFTAMLILQLVEEGTLQLDGKLTQYLPEFPKEKGQNITIHQLLTHTAGIIGESRITDLVDIEKEFYTREELLNIIAQQELVFEPGKGREYSNFGYALLGLIIEEVTGKSYDKALYSNSLLTEESKELFFNEYGWHYERYPIGKGVKRILSISLNGSINGFQSHTQRIEKDTVFIVTLRNVKESVYENEIVIKWPNFMVSRILAVLYDEPYDFPKKSAAFAVFDTLIHSGQEDAEKLYAKIMNEQLDRYYIDESEFDYFESELMNSGMADMAKYYQRIHTEH